MHNETDQMSGMLAISIFFPWIFIASSKNPWHFSSSRGTSSARWKDCMTKSTGWADSPTVPADAGSVNMER